MASSLRLSVGPLRELRIHLCQSSAASNGVREFIQNNYVTIKQNNAKFPFLIRECSGISPCVWARYDHGTEVSVSLENQSSAKVLSIIQDLAVQKA